MATIAGQPHTVVAVFRSTFNAYVALRRLDRAGLPPEDVSLVAGEPELEDEVRRLRYAPRGAIAGAAIGLLIGAAYVIFGAPGLLEDVFGALLGIAFAVAAGAFGAAAGRAVARRSSRLTQFEDVVKRGGAIVTVACGPGVRDRALEVLEGAGADRIVDEVAAG